MARVVEVERRLIEWADWKRRETRAESRLGLSGAPVTFLPDNVRLMARIVESMPAPLGATLIQVYVERETMARHAEKLGCPETTLARRLGRAHLFIADHLAGACQRDREEQHRANAAEDLLRRLGPKTKE